MRETAQVGAWVRQEFGNFTAITPESTAKNREGLLPGLS